jgi:uncharacterized protein
MSTPRYVFWKSEADGQWYFHLKSANGKVVHGSEGYKSKAGCIGGIRAAKRAAARAVVKELGNKTPLQV